MHIFYYEPIIYFVCEIIIGKITILVKKSKRYTIIYCIIKHLGLQQEVRNP